jgi:hypothetical protein
VIRCGGWSSQQGRAGLGWAGGILNELHTACGVHTLAGCLLVLRVSGSCGVICRGRRSSQQRVRRAMGTLVELPTSWGADAGLMLACVPHSTGVVDDMVALVSTHTGAVACDQQVEQLV